MTLACAMLLSACTTLFGDGAPPNKEQTQLEFQVEASSLINPDDSSRPSPVLVRIYELRNETLFQDADFFSLYNNDKAILQGDMLAVEQFILRPGETRSLRRKGNPQANVIGVLAAYRDLPNATWRTLYKLPPARDIRWYSPIMRDEKVRLRIGLQSKVVSIIDLATGATSEPAANVPSSASGVADSDGNTSTLKGPALPPKEETIRSSKSLGEAIKLLPTK